MDRSSSRTNASRNGDYMPPSRVARMAISSSRSPAGSTAEAVATARRAEYGTGGSILPVLPTAPSASKRTSWTAPRSLSDSIDDELYQSSNDALSPSPRRAEMVSVAATRRAEPVRPRSVSDDLFTSNTEQAQLAYMEQIYGTFNLLNAELESERRSRPALEAATAARPSTYPAMSDFSLEGDVQILVNEFDEPSTGFIVSQSPVAPSHSPRKLRTMPSPPSQPPQRVARPPTSPRAAVKDQDTELCATLGKNAELRIRSRGMERTVEKTELELELARKQIKMVERRVENREEKLRELLREKLRWQKELKSTRAQVAEEKMRQVDLFREVEAAKREFAAELEAVDQELGAVQEENTQLRTRAAEMKAQMNFLTRKMEDMARQSQDEKARFVSMIEDTRHRFREWKEGEAEALAVAHDQAVRALKTEYELKMERHQDEKKKLRDKVNDLEVSMRLLQKDRTLSPLELSLRKTAILGSKGNSSTVEAEHIKTQSRILELENLLAHSQAYQARQESIIKLSETTISRLMQAREVAALENLSLHPFGVESPRSEELLYDTPLMGYVTAPSSPGRPMSPPKTPARRPLSAAKSNDPSIASSLRSRPHTPRRTDQETSTAPVGNSGPSLREKTLMDELVQLRKELAEAQAKAAEVATKEDVQHGERHESGDLESVDMPDAQAAEDSLRLAQDENGDWETATDNIQNGAAAQSIVEESDEAEDKNHADVPMNTSKDKVPWESLQALDNNELQVPSEEKEIRRELSELVDESITNDTILDAIDSPPDDNNVEDTPPAEGVAQECIAASVNSTEETSGSYLETEAPPGCLKHEKAPDSAEESKACEQTELPSTDIVPSIATEEEEAVVGEPVEATEMPGTGAELKDAGQFLNLGNADVTVLTSVQDGDGCSSELETEPHSLEQLKSDKSIANESEGIPAVVVRDVLNEEPSQREKDENIGVETDNCANNIDFVDSEIVDGADPGIADAKDSSATNIKPEDESSNESEGVCMPPAEVASEVEVVESMRLESEVSRLLQEEDVASPPTMLGMSALENEHEIYVTDSADSVPEALIEIVECVSSHQDSKDDVSDVISDNADAPLSFAGTNADAKDPNAPVNFLPVESRQAYMAKVLVDLAECTALSKVLCLQGRTDGSERVEEVPVAANVMEGLVTQAIDILDGDSGAPELEELAFQVDASGTFVAAGAMSAVNDDAFEMGDLMEDQPTASDDQSCAAENVAETNEDVHAVAAVAKTVAATFVEDFMKTIDTAPTRSGNQEVNEAIASENASLVEEMVTAEKAPALSSDINDSDINVAGDSPPMAGAPLSNDEVADPATVSEDGSTPTEMTEQRSRVVDPTSEDSDALPTEPTTTDDSIQSLVSDVADTLTIARDFVDTVETEALTSVVSLLQNESPGKTKCEEFESIDWTPNEQNEPSTIVSGPEGPLESTAEPYVANVVEPSSYVESNSTNEELEDSICPALLLDVVEEPKAPICDEFSTQEIVSGMACRCASQAIAVALCRLSQSCDLVSEESAVYDALDVEVADERKHVEEPCLAEVELEANPDTSESTRDDTSVPILKGEANEAQLQQPASDQPHNTSSCDNGVIQPNVTASPSTSADDTSIVDSKIRDLVDAVEKCGQGDTVKAPDEVIDPTNDVPVAEGDLAEQNAELTTASNSCVQQVSEKAADEASESLETDSLKTEDADKHDEIELYGGTFGSSLEDDTHVISLSVERLVDVDAVVAATNTSSLSDPIADSIVRKCPPKHARSVRFAFDTKEKLPDHPRRSVLLWQAPNDKACAKEAVENSAKRRASKRRISRRTLPDLLAFPTETARITSSDTTLLAYDARHEQGHIFSLLDQSILSIDPNGRHIDLDDSDERVQSKIIGKRKTLTQEIHLKNLALRQIPRFNYMPMRIKFQWSDFVVATPVRPSSSNLGEVKSPVEPMRLLLKKGAKLPCGSYVIVSAFIRPLEDGNENLRVQIYDAERVEEFQFDFSEDMMKKYHLERTGMGAQSLEFLGHLEFRRDEDTIIIKLPDKKAGEGSRTEIDRMQRELIMVGGDLRKRDPPTG
ncbi:uncharacterized protein PITG_01057 [Phytophthora infestans T30-4]|uniref:Uncharacterized protein n=1 Tax=Phytophthora infestans (strain T30-4) TaxID=403677 RepID=D0MSC5_PHYIT|nr:uncharacterized protein PITG_01057 [Phytophthora infestans T30-4]EEY58394.1 conserved hypothetical protein [Phytophthora infestans T30-4]|eukprot:XP_002909580.1 conserved hypothetical protein [Phytophthora infestans T30-4]